MRRPGGGQLRQAEAAGVIGHRRPALGLAERMTCRIPRRATVRRAMGQQRNAARAVERQRFGVAVGELRFETRVGDAKEAGDVRVGIRHRSHRVVHQGEEPLLLRPSRRHRQERQLDVGRSEQRDGTEPSTAISFWSATPESQAGLASSLNLGAHRACQRDEGRGGQCGVSHDRLPHAPHAPRPLLLPNEMTRRMPSSCWRDGASCGENVALAARCATPASTDGFTASARAARGGAAASCANPAELAHRPARNSPMAVFDILHPDTSPGCEDAPSHGSVDGIRAPP